jgi:hypothetical protein
LVLQNDPEVTVSKGVVGIAAQHGSKQSLGLGQSPFDVRCHALLEQAIDRRFLGAAGWWCLRHPLRLSSPWQPHHSGDRHCEYPARSPQKLDHAHQRFQTIFHRSYAMDLGRSPDQKTRAIT